jgi:lysophospholipase L1-like esterase
VVFNSLLRKKNEIIKRPRVKRSLQNAALVISSSLFFFVLIEISFRLLGYGNLVIYQPDPKLFWKPLPNQNCYTKVGRKPIHINSHGTRGEDFDLNKPSDVYRIISLGDSRTFGWGLEESETYSGVLERLLRNQLGGKRKIEVINAGVNAWSYSQIYVYLRDVAMRYSPDMVILADANLWTQFSENTSTRFKEQMTKRVKIKNLLRRCALYHFIIEVKLAQYYDKYRTKFIPVDPSRDELFKEQQVKGRMLTVKQQISNICNLLNKNEVKSLIIHIPEENSLLSTGPKSEILKIKEEVSKKYNMPFIDFTEAFSRDKRKLFLLGDPIHPNRHGNQIIADRMFYLIALQLTACKCPNGERFTEHMLAGKLHLLERK